MLVAGAAQAGSLRLCADANRERSAAQQDRLLRFAAVLRGVLESSGRESAIVSRSGLDLARFGLRYSHASVALAQGAPRWAVRQLYYACDEGRPRLYDEGLAAFAGGTADPDRGFVTVLLLPPAADAALAATARDDRRALALLGGTYSANAYPFALRYQNCNQWLAELLATAWGELAPGRPARAAAQDWLQAAGYRPSRVDAGSHWVMFAGGFVPWLHYDDRPQSQRYDLVWEVSLPASIEAFARARWPAAERVELCHAGGQVVVRRGWDRIAEGCLPGPHDEVLDIDDDGR